MARYIAKRLLQIVLLVFLVSIVTYFLVEMIPGDRVFITYGDRVSPSEYQAYYEALGLDQPVAGRYFRWLTAALRGVLGTSIKYKLPVISLLGSKLPITIYLSVLSALISLPIGIGLGVICAKNRGKMSDAIITTVSNVVGCLPGFWIALLLMFVFSLKLHWLPSFGFTWFWEDWRVHIQQLIMPMICLLLGEIAGICRQTRSSVLECIRQDYVRTARAKGVPEKVIMRVHVLKNALIPIITLVGSRLAGLIGGALLVESVFSIPGMGSLMQNAITSKDIPLLIAIVCLTAIVSGVAYILTDLMYMVCDPRITLINE